MLLLSCDVLDAPAAADSHAELPWPARFSLLPTPGLVEEPEDDAERQTWAAEQTTFRPQLKAIAERITPTRWDADHA